MNFESNTTFNIKDLSVIYKIVNRDGKQRYEYIVSNDDKGHYNISSVLS